MNQTITTKKSLGQHWLDDKETLEYICRQADLKTTDTVLEIGPGTGNLTKYLVKQATQVIAVEKDEVLVKQLLSQQIAKNLQIIESDILNFDLRSLPTGYKVVANIPYYLTSNLIRVLSESSNPPSLLVLLVQKEVAERVASKPGQMSLLSVSAQFFWQVSIGKIVPAKLFTPPPKVDSRILILKKRPKPLFNDVDEQLFFQVVKAGFAAKRKTILNSLAGGLRTEKQQIENIIRRAGLRPNQRPQELSLDDWHKIYLTYKNQH